MLLSAPAPSPSWLHCGPMKVFLSWSKEPSKSIATFLRGWLTDVIQSLEPWMSGEDIPVGDRWANQISGELESRNYGILILTPENQFQPWINYEAGALSKMVGSSRVIPYTFGFKPADVSSAPLTAFQGVEANEEGTWKMLVEINKALASPLTEQQLRRAFEKNWGDLDAELKRVAQEEAKREKANPGTTPPPRSDSDKLDEMLVLLRNMAAGPSERVIHNLERRSKQTMSADDTEVVLAGNGVLASIIKQELDPIMDSFAEINDYELNISSTPPEITVRLISRLQGMKQDKFLGEVRKILPNAKIYYQSPLL